MKKVIFLTNGHGFGYAHTTGEKVSLPDATADELTDQGVVKLDDSIPESDLPTDLPGRAVFLKQGFTFDEVKGIPDFKEIEGISDKIAADVVAYLEALTPKE